MLARACRTLGWTERRTSRVDRVHQARPKLSPGESRQLSLRFMEPLEESVYLDQVQLMAVTTPPKLRFIPTNISPVIPRTRRQVVFSRERDRRRCLDGAWP